LVEGTAVNVVDEVKTVLGRTLQLGSRVALLDDTTGLFGSMAEFDSMAVVTVVTALEERFGFVVEDDEITADVFETVGTLSKYVEGKLGLK
jgi:acyl carrier protein